LEQSRNLSRQIPALHSPGEAGPIFRSTGTPLYPSPEAPELPEFRLRNYGPYSYAVAPRGQERQHSKALRSLARAEGGGAPPWFAACAPPLAAARAAGLKLNSAP